MPDLSAPRRRRTSFGELTTATAGLPAPCAALDLAALRTNAADLLRRAAGKPIRIASKSVRSRAVLHGALALDGMAGVLAYTLPEALWLAGEIEDVLLGYPTADEQALAALAADEQLAARVTLMIDSADQLEFTAAALGSPGGPPIRVCLELDASLRLAAGRLHVGSRRSPAHSPEAVARLARAVTRHPRFTLVGLMAYEGQIAGIGDNQPGSPVTRLGVRAMQRASAAELHERRAAAVAAVRAVAPLEFVNGGGTGSLELTSAEEAVTEVAAGSGLFAPALFDHYTRFHPLPAAHFALPVVRRPSPRHATVLGGGWIASGPPGRDRLPVPVWPRGLRLLATEGAGEVQTPLGGPGAAGLRIGDRVWFRHAKAGELCEHVDELHLVDEGRLTGSAPTYRGEGKTFL
ncbi:amino acid deaminase/aldolase [Streptomyces physcomitrii]|uniref:amino acid deaminase/aldolase n=1 Tax=Streptomyces physcomitrii TaxID=2724184 RepID=UPI0033FD5D0B